MRHRVKGKKLGRKAAHRRATLRALSTALIKHKRIKTTVAKAKALRMFVEPLITKAKKDTVHSRRLIAREIHDKAVVQELFNEVIPKIGDRPGGYTRIVRLGNRVGDAAEMALIELVDYNDVTVTKPKKSKKKADKTEDKASGKSEQVKETAQEDKVAEEKPEETKAEEKSEADDLTKIEGIGPKIAEIMNSKNIKTYSDLANASVDNLKEILAEAGSRYKSHDPTTWPEQAKLAAEGKWDELKKLQDELDGGRVKKDDSGKEEK